MGTAVGAAAFPLVGIPGLLAVLNAGGAFFYMTLLGRLGVLTFLNRALWPAVRAPLPAIRFPGY